MSTFLVSETFDNFLLEEATITSYNTFHIDGRFVPDFFNKEEEDISFLEEYSFSKWKNMRPICFSLIKGKKTPVNFKFIFQLHPLSMKKLLENGDTNLTEKDVKAFVLNLKYENGQLTLITGTSTFTFLMDKSADSIWDDAFRKFLNSHGISYEA
ncbi:MAG: DUF5721 family protein [Lachnospiraceae bacterium]|nr:DUF5721 family protein [Lachnospiraceae bacterium]